MNHPCTLIRNHNERLMERKSIYSWEKKKNTQKTNPKVNLISDSYIALHHCAHLFQLAGSVKFLIDRWLILSFQPNFLLDQLQRSSVSVMPWIKVNRIRGEHMLMSAFHVVFFNRIYSAKLRDLHWLNTNTIWVACWKVMMA